VAVQIAAVGGLVSQQDPAALPALQQVVTDPARSGEVAAAAKSAIRQLERFPYPPQSDIEPRRFREELSRAASDARARVELRQRLVAALPDPSAKVRSRAAKALGELGDKRAVPALIRLLHDPVAGVRQSAIVALGALKSRRAVPALLEFIAASPDIRHDLPALFALRDIGDPRALPAVLQAMEQGPQFLPGILHRDRVIECLVTRENLPLLQETITRMEAASRGDVGGEPEAQWAAMRAALLHISGNALARVAGAGDVPALLAAFDRDPHSYALTKALVRFADPALLEPMRRHLLAGHANAAMVLAKLGAASLPVFKEALQSPQVAVRNAASFFLFNGEGSQVVRNIADGDLLQLLDTLAQHDPNGTVRLHARAAARRIRRPRSWQR
ncbi:MAG TPA: HEAT repeat domain-containing protein, partial [Armatimonadota bacterium]|nr:HEAT repeat domain-containing protein [Armatimonadota bacterium]